MKTPFLLALSASLASALLFTSCTKENTSPSQVASSSNSSNSVTADRIETIMADLSTSSYSLSFTKTYPRSGIAKTAYGTDNYLAFADPQDLICGDPIRLKYKQIAIWKRPNIVWPTCPDMSIDIYKLGEVQKLLVSADPKLYGAVKQIKFINTEGAFLGTDAFTSQFPAMKLDKIDDAITTLSLDKFLMLNDPKNLGSGASRSFYGYADLNTVVLQPYKKSLTDLLKPTLKGCYDPTTIKALQDKLKSIDPVYYKGLNITYLAENKNIAILSLN